VAPAQARRTSEENCFISPTIKEKEKKEKKKRDREKKKKRRKKKHVDGTSSNLDTITGRRESRGSPCLPYIFDEDASKSTRIRFRRAKLDFPRATVIDASGV